MPSLIDLIDDSACSSQSSSTKSSTTLPNQIINNHTNYTLDISYMPHLLSTTTTTNTIINNNINPFNTSVNNNNNNNNNKNCIDLDLYDYLLKKSKLSTFTLWDLTATPNQTLLTNETMKNSYDRLVSCQNLSNKNVNNDDNDDDLEIIKQILDEILTQMEQNELTKCEVPFVSVNSETQEPNSDTLTTAKPSLDDQWLTAREDLSLLSSTMSSYQASTSSTGDESSSSSSLSSIEILENNVRKITLKSKEIVLLEDCESDDDGNEFASNSNHIDFDLFKDFSFNNPVIYKNNGRKVPKVPSFTNTATTSVSSDDQDACIKEALKRFDAFCKSKYHVTNVIGTNTTAVTSTVGQPSTNLTSAKSSQQKTNDYSSFIKRRQARIQSLFNNNNNESEKKVNNIELSRSKSPCERQPMIPDCVNLSPSSSAREFLEASSHVNNKAHDNVDNAKHEDFNNEALRTQEKIDIITSISDELPKNDVQIDSNEQKDIEKDELVQTDIKEPNEEHAKDEFKIINLEQTCEESHPARVENKEYQTIQPLNLDKNEPQELEAQTPSIIDNFLTEELPLETISQLNSQNESQNIQKQESLTNGLSFQTSYKNDIMIKDRDSYVLNYINSLSKSATSESNENSSPHTSPRRSYFTNESTKEPEEKRPIVCIEKPTNKALVDFLNGKDQITPGVSKIVPQVNGNKHVNIIKLEVINSARNVPATRSTSESRMRLSSNEAANKSDQKDSLRGSQDSETSSSITSESWRQKLKEMYKDANNESTFQNSRKSSIDKTSSIVSEPQKAITPRSTSTTGSSSKPESRIIPIELKRKSVPNEVDKMPSPNNEIKSPRGIRETQKQNVSSPSPTTPSPPPPPPPPLPRPTVFNSEYRESSLPPKRSPRDDTNDPVAEKACNNFMYKLMEYKRQQQYAQPLAAPTSLMSMSSPYGRTLYTESILNRPQIDYEPYTATPITTTYRSTNEPEADEYRASRSRENSVPDDAFYSNNDTISATYSTSLEKPYVSSIRKRRTLFSDQSTDNNNRVYSRPYLNGNDYYCSSRGVERNFNYTVTPHSPSVITTSSSTMVTPQAAICTVSSPFAFSHALNRPLSIVNEEDRNSLKASLDKMQTIVEKQKDTLKTTSVLKTRPSSTATATTTSVPKKYSSTTQPPKVPLSVNKTSTNLNGLTSNTTSQSSITSSTGVGMLNTTSVAHQASVFDRLASTLDRKKAKSKLNFSSNNSNCSENEMNDTASVSSFSKKYSTSSAKSPQAQSNDVKVSNSTFRIRSLETSAREKLKKEVPKKYPTVQASNTSTKSTNHVEIPVKVEHVIPITIESKTKTDSPQMATRKKSTTQSTYAFGSSIPKTNTVTNQTDELFDRLNKKTSSMKNLSNILKRTISHEPATSATSNGTNKNGEHFNSSSVDLFNLGLSIAPEQTVEIDIDGDLDTETCVNTKMNQKLSKNGTNVFERLYKGNQQPSNTNPINSLLFPHNGESHEQLTTNGASQKTLRKNMSLSTASLSSSTSGSNIVQSSQSNAAIKKLNNEQRTLSRTSLNKKTSTTSTNSQQPETVHERLSLSKSTGKTLLKDQYQKSTLDLTSTKQLATQSASSLPKSSSPDSCFGTLDDEQTRSTTSMQTGSVSASSAVKKSNFTNRIKGLFKKNVN